MENSQKKYPEFPVLVVDDNRQFLNSIGFELPSKGITNVECCQDSMEVMPLLKKKKYSVILLDMIMPGIDGLKLLPNIVNEYPDIPVIVLTGHPDKITSIICNNLGASGYWQKLDDTKELIATIQNALHSKKETKSVNTEKDEESDEVGFRITIYCHAKPPKIYSLKEEEQEEEKKFLQSFFKLRPVKIDIEGITKGGAYKKKIELSGMDGLIFRYLAYKNYKALKNPDHRNWKEIPVSYEYRLSGTPSRNHSHIPEWNVLFDYLKRNDRVPDSGKNSGTIRQWILSLKRTLDSAKIKNIIDSSKGGKGSGYLLKGWVEFDHIE